MNHPVMRNLVSLLFLWAPLTVVILSQILWFAFTNSGHGGAGSPLLLRLTFPTLLLAGIIGHFWRR